MVWIQCPLLAAINDYVLWLGYLWLMQVNFQDCIAVLLKSRQSSAILLTLFQLFCTIHSNDSIYIYDLFRFSSVTVYTKANWLSSVKSYLNNFYIRPIFYIIIILTFCTCISFMYISVLCLFYGLNVWNKDFDWLIDWLIDCFAITGEF